MNPIVQNALPTARQQLITVILSQPKTLGNERRRERNAHLTLGREG